MTAGDGNGKHGMVGIGNQPTNQNQYIRIKNTIFIFNRSVTIALCAVTPILGDGKHFNLIIGLITEG